MDKAKIEGEIKSKTDSAQTIYNSKIELLTEQFDRKAEEMGRKYQIAEEEAKATYLEMLNEMSHNFSEESILTQTQMIELRKQLNELKSKHDAAVEEYKRAEEMKTKINFYRIQISDIDKEEINKIQEIGQYLRDTKPLNKVIWSVYYDHPFSDLIGRVVGVGCHTGIYKLTNLTNGMVYVGQANNIADRWKQHVKCALGAETAPNNKLYPAMQEVGPENFSFEIIEECAQEDLNEREQYWQDFYKAKEFGYSIR